MTTENLVARRQAREAILAEQRRKQEAEVELEVERRTRQLARRARLDEVIDNLTAKEFVPPADPLAVLRQVRSELSSLIADGISDGSNDVCVGWLEDVAELLQLDLPTEDELTDL